MFMFCLLYLYIFSKGKPFEYIQFCLLNEDDELYNQNICLIVVMRYVDVLCI